MNWENNIAAQQAQVRREVPAWWSAGMTGEGRECTSAFWDSGLWREFQQAAALRAYCRPVPDAHALAPKLPFLPVVLIQRTLVEETMA